MPVPQKTPASHAEFPAPLNEAPPVDLDLKDPEEREEREEREAFLQVQIESGRRMRAVVAEHYEDFE